MGMLATAAAALGAAALAHVVLRRARHRIDARINRRRRSDRPTGPLRLAALALLALQWIAWLAALRVATSAHPVTDALRADAQEMLSGALQAPLFSMSGREVSALDVLLLPVMALGLWIAVNALTHLLRTSLLRSAGLEGGTEETAAGLLRYGLAVVGGLVALHAVGVDVRGLAIAGGVLGVGIGFGLQNLANNFVSGLVIGFERPVRPGDFVQIGDHLGTVLRVGARSTAIRTLDRVTVLIPNSRFLETEVVNWSHGDPVSRVHVPIGVEYGSDVGAVRAALLAAARSHPAVLREPRPQVQMRAFGGSSLDFELLVWTRDPRNQSRLTSDLNFQIEAELPRHGVRVPFPQLDVHVHGAQAAPPAEAVAAALAAGPPREPRHAGPPVPRVPATPSREERSPEEWTVTELFETLARMRGSDGVARADRRHLLRVYPDCFVGSEAVAWLEANESLTRNEACALGERLVELGWVRHVLDEHGFVDGNYYYRFEASPAG